MSLVVWRWYASIGLQKMALLKSKSGIDAISLLQLLSQ